jgi:hypothetical protein
MTLSLYTGSTRDRDMPDYSSTPLVKKLGLKTGMRIAWVNAPPSFFSVLGPLPDDITLVDKPRAPLDLAIVFVTSKAELTKRFDVLAQKLARAGVIWVAWPKQGKNERPTTDLDFNAVQQVGLASGLVDVKVCAIDEVWSALKFVIPVNDRQTRAPAMRAAGRGGETHG